MAMRIVCSKCGCINKLNDYDCDHCGRDISEDRKTEIPKQYLSFKFFNKLDGPNGSYSDIPPFDPLPVKNSAPEPISEHQIPNVQNEHQEPHKSADLVKICPSCEAVCDASAMECECGCYLKRVTAIERKSEAKAPVHEDKPTETNDGFDCDFDDGADDDQLYLLIGKNGENEIPLVFSNNMYIIGRDHQSCLSDCNYVSRNHCMIKRSEKGDLYLGENRSRPSTNGTFLRTVGERRERLVPGKGYKITVGTVFYLDSIPVVLHKKLC